MLVTVQTLHCKQTGWQEIDLAQKAKYLFCFTKAEPATFPGICCSGGAAHEGLWQAGHPAVQSYQLMYHHLFLLTYFILS